MSSPRLRFAPSPTGLLHLGNARIALFNWLYAKQQGGQFILRLDDSDLLRSKVEFQEGIEQDLMWLGLQWDDFFRQSDRFERYAQAGEQLKKSGYLYPCYETPQELDLKRKRQLSLGKAPVYDRKSLQLTPSEKEELAKTRKPHWRFLLDHHVVTWDDLFRSTVRISCDSLSDPVLIREDGVPLYTLCSVVDDMDSNITHILRGEDHVTNTAVQIQLAKGLGAAHLPIFGHIPLITDSKGQGLSKRIGGYSLQELRNQGILPMAIINLLIGLGGHEFGQLKDSLNEWIEHFDLNKFSRSSPKFSMDQLTTMNQKYIHMASFESIMPFLSEHFPPHLWPILQKNSNSLSDLALWNDLCTQPPQWRASLDCEQFILKIALEYLPKDVLQPNAWEDWIAHIKSASGYKSGQVFKPLRMALTGKEHGPELKQLFFILGHDQVYARLQDALSKCQDIN